MYKWVGFSLLQAITLPSLNGLLSVTLEAAACVCACVRARVRACVCVCVAADRCSALHVWAACSGNWTDEDEWCGGQHF